MDREAQNMLDRLESQLSRIAYALELGVGAGIIGAAFTHRCSECHCGLLTGVERNCPVCGIALKGEKDVSGG